MSSIKPLPEQIKTINDICFAQAKKDSLFFGLLITFFLLIVIVLVINIGLTASTGKGLFRKMTG